MKANIVFFLFLLAVVLGITAQAWVLHIPEEHTYSNFYESNDTDYNDNNDTDYNTYPDNSNYTYTDYTDENKGREPIEEVAANNNSHPDSSPLNPVDSVGEDEEFEEIFDKAETYIGEIGESTDVIEAMIKSIKLAELNKETTANIPERLNDGGEDKIDVEDMYDVVTDFLEETLDKTEEMQSEIDEALEDLNSVKGSALSRNEIVTSLRSVQTSLASQAKRLATFFQQVDEMRDNREDSEEDQPVTDGEGENAATDEENLFSDNADDEDLDAFGDNGMDDGTDEFSIGYMRAIEDEEDNVSPGEPQDSQDPNEFHINDETGSDEDEMFSIEGMKSEIDELLSVTSAPTDGDYGLLINDLGLDETQYSELNEPQIGLSENETAEMAFTKEQNKGTATLESSFLENPSRKVQLIENIDVDSTNNLKLNLLHQKNKKLSIEENNTRTIDDEPALDNYNIGSDLATAYPLAENATESIDYNIDGFDTTAFDMDENASTPSLGLLFEETTQPDEVYEYMDEMTTAQSVPDHEFENVFLDIMKGNLSTDETLINALTVEETDVQKDEDKASSEDSNIYENAGSKNFSINDLIKLFNNDTLSVPEFDTEESQNVYSMYLDAQNRNYVDYAGFAESEKDQDSDDFDLPVLKPIEREDFNVHESFPLDMTENYDLPNQQDLFDEFSQTEMNQENGSLTNDGWEIGTDEKTGSPKTPFNPYSFLNEIDVQPTVENDKRTPSSNHEDYGLIVNDDMRDLYDYYLDAHSQAPEDTDTHNLQDLTEDEQDMPEENQFKMEEQSNEEENTKYFFYDDVNGEDMDWDESELDGKKEAIKKQILFFSLDKDMYGNITKVKDDKWGQRSTLLWSTTVICVLGLTLTFFFFACIGLKRQKQRWSSTSQHVPYTVMEDGRDEINKKLPHPKLGGQPNIYNIKV